MYQSHSGESAPASLNKVCVCSLHGSGPLSSLAVQHSGSVHPRLSVSPVTVKSPIGTPHLGMLWPPLLPSGHSILGSLYFQVEDQKIVFFFSNRLSSIYNHALQNWESKCVTRTALSPHVLPIGKRTNPARLVWGTVESVSSSWGLAFIIIDPQNPRAKTSFP